MKIRKTGILLSLSCLAAVASASPALAFDWQDLLRTYLSSGQAGTSEPEQALIKTNINTRQAQLEREIESGVASGQLTPQEETQLRMQLNAVAALEGNYLADGNLSGNETRHLVEELSNVSRTLNTYLTNASNTGSGTSRHDWWFRKYVGSGSPDAVPGNQRLIQANIDARQAELDSSIEQAVLNGRISWNKAREFRSELNRIANLERTYLADGRLSYREEEQLTNDLRNLNTRVQSEVANRYGGRRYASRGRSIDQQQSWIRRRLETGLRSGRLTQSEYRRLVRDAEKIETLESKLRTSGRRLSFNEEKLVLAELDDLTRKVNRELTDRNVQ